MPVLIKPVIYLPKVGPKYKALLEKLEIITIEDLIQHYPFRYDDFSVLKNIVDMAEGETVTLEATLVKIDNIFTKFGKKITKARIQDNTGFLDITWFNQHYIKNSFVVGDTYRFSGKVTKFANKLTIISPTFEIVKENSLNTNRLVPVYQETAGVTSKWLRARINDVLSGIKAFEEFLPDGLINKYKLISYDTAIRQIHFPDNKETLENSRKRLGFEELFLELLNVEDKKRQWSKDKNPVLIKPFDKEVETLINSLPFKLTDSQEDAIKEIINDMTQKHAMNRLLEGDVGTGKTVVAVIAAYLTCLNGFKVLYMAPTEILAKQHYETFAKFLDKRVEQIDLITGSVKPTDNKANILIGTHAILNVKEPMDKVGLIIIDEQQRFGVEQRTQLGEISPKPHLLTMTATPIPRTLALTLFGDLSLSTLKTPPNKDKKIITKLIPENKRNEAFEWIKNKGEQAFIVCPLIEMSESESLENVKSAQIQYELLKDGVFNGLSVGLLHGRMKPKEKAEIINKYRNKEIQILVATPVIEVGIDVPEATIMVIESAERYGLASLHQLRGRVGRGNKVGYCLIFASNSSRTSYERLKNLEKIDSGLELAEIDLKMRGYGELYGTLQHGFKKLKIADLSDLSLMEKAKEAAQEYYPKLDNYANLKDKLSQELNKLVGNN